MDWRDRWVSSSVLRALSVSLPVPWPLTSFSTPLLQGLRLTQTPEMVQSAIASARPAKVIRTGRHTGKLVRDRKRQALGRKKRNVVYWKAFV